MNKGLERALENLALYHSNYRYVEETNEYKLIKQALSKLEKVNEAKDNLDKLVDRMEKEVKDSTHSMYSTFVLGVALKVMEDRLWDIDDIQAQKCNVLQHKLLGDEKI